MLSNMKMPHWIQTAIALAGVAFGAILTAAKAGTLPVSPQVAGWVIVLGVLVQYVSGMVSTSIIPSANFRAAKSAGLVTAAQIAQTVAPLFMVVVGLCLTLAACLKPPTAAQQAQDGEALAACVAQFWGQPIATVAAACTANEITVAEDAIADLELAIENATGSNTSDGGVMAATMTFQNAYASDAEVMSHLTKGRAAGMAARH